MTRSLAAAFLVGAIIAPAALAAQGTPGAPQGLDELVRWPEDNRRSPARIALGARLFFDSILSADGTASCAGCHRPERAFAGSPAEDSPAKPDLREAPSLLNRGYATRFFWDGRTNALEEAVLLPISDPAELDLPLREAVRRLRADPSYRAAFLAAYGRAPSVATLGAALAAYLRSLRSGGAPADRFEAGDTAALSPSARRGRDLFRGRAGCWVCHGGPLFTDHAFHNTGVSWGSEDTGLHLRTGRAQDRGRFRTPSLRNVARTDPYMHDGSIRSLEEVVDFYADGQGANPNLDTELRRPPRLTAEEREDLVAYLMSLGGAGSPPL
ncbi:MAG: cytochrome c peroxidase [Longimicrobiales bacterium]